MLETPIDLLGLRDAPLPALLETAATVADAGGPSAALTGLSDLCVAETVRLLRDASTTEVGEASSALRRFLAAPSGRAARVLAAGAHDRLSGLLPLLTAASSPSSKGGQQAVRRAWNGKADEALAKLAAAGGQLARADLRRQLNVSESYVSHLLTDLEAARLVERISEAGRKSVTVYLTAEGREAVPDACLPAAAVIPFLARVKVPPAHNAGMNRRLECFEQSGGASGQFPAAARR
jgi:DNA-binding transcriptional ArsR family regulator